MPTDQIAFNASGKILFKDGKVCFSCCGEGEPCVDCATPGVCGVTCASKFRVRFDGPEESLQCAFDLETYVPMGVWFELNCYDGEGAFYWDSLDPEVTDCLRFQLACWVFGEELRWAIIHFGTFIAFDLGSAGAAPDCCPPEGTYDLTDAGFSGVTMVLEAV